MSMRDATFVRYPHLAAPTLFALLFVCPSAFAQADSPGVEPVVRAVRTSRPPTVDGRLDEAGWELAPAADRFTQRNPDEGLPATERTEVRVIYDAQALYVGIRLFDREPDRITRRLSRRDEEADADRVVVYLDPRHDHLTGAAFELSAAGVQADRALYDDTRSDEAWDAVWTGAVSLDGRGWTAEMRIPYSQLRFANRASHTWGINVERVIRRTREDAWLVLTPKKERGLVSRMGHLAGLEGIAPKPHLALLPYAVARGEMVAPERPGDPFNDGSLGFVTAGLDVKWGVSTGFTLDATVNPDFGQVELDPAVINLTAFETFFEEKRPFFTEGAQIFRNFGRLGGADADAPDLFYSRRIGRDPQGSASGDYVDRPSSSTILGAAKLTGKTRSGWSVGLLAAGTSREDARVQSGGARSEVPVEPFTTHLVGRLLRENGRGGVGLIGTGVLRSLQDDGLEGRLARRAFTGGADGYYFFDAGREWLLSGQLSASAIQGSPASIERLQRSSSRYFQRPDALRLDPSRGSLSGWSGSASFGRESGSLRAGATISAVSPAFESNDLGYLTRADRVAAEIGVSWEKFEPDRLTRRRELSFSRDWDWNFDGDGQGGDWSAALDLVFLNWWDADFNVRREVGGLDDRLTRGGPMAGSPAGWDLSFDGGTDSRKPVYARAEAAHEWNEAGGWETRFELSLDVKISGHLTVSTGPEVMRARDVAQYVGSRQDPLAASTFGRRYLFGSLEQSEVSMQTRLNLLLTPTMSLQLYAQPLVGTGRFSAIRELARPRAYDFRTYGGGDSTLTYDAKGDSYLIDPDGPGPATAFTLENPDFNEKSLRVQTVFRWEWRPGSTLYVVWAQNREHESSLGRFDLARDLRRLFGANGDDVLELKVSYWIGR